MMLILYLRQKLAAYQSHRKRKVNLLNFFLIFSYFLVPLFPLIWYTIPCKFHLYMIAFYIIFTSKEGRLNYEPQKRRRFKIF